MSHVLLITTLTVTLTSTSESLFLFGERTRRSCSFTWQTLSKVFSSFLLVSFLTFGGPLYEEGTSLTTSLHFATRTLVISFLNPKP
jgi:hypothetical protein